MRDLHWCFQCYGLNRCSSGRCEHCGGEISMPAGITFEEQLIWTLGHPDGDRAVLAARTLGVRRTSGAVPYLREIVSSRSDPFLAVESLRSLIAIEGADALRPLLTSLAEQGPFMVANVARGALGGGAASAPAPEEGT